MDTGTYSAPGTDQAGYQLSGGYNCVYGTSGVRYLDVGNSQTERLLFNNWWKEQIAQYGQQVSYYINGYNLSAHDYFYGEQPLVRFSVPIPIVMALTLSNDNVILSKFGLQGEADLTAIIPIDTFYATVTAISGVLSAANYEPKAGDLIELSEYGSLRPGGRSGKVFEITERVDEMGGENNQLLGHYVWMIKAKRYDFTYELDAPREALMDQVYDNKADGLQNNLPKIIETKEYTQFVDKDSKQVFDYSENSQSNNSVYGDYDDDNTLVNLVGVTNAAGGTTGALGASASTYVVVQSPSNYSDIVTRTSLASANTAALYTLYTLLSTYNPALSSMVPILPEQESSTQNARIPAPFDLQTLTTLLSALGIIPPPGP
jgi:hypothetical protein